MMVRSLALLAASASLAISPIAAQAAPDRVAAPAAESEELAGRGIGAPGAIAAIFVFALIIYLLSKGDRLDSPPRSP